MKMNKGKKREKQPPIWVLDEEAAEGKDKTPGLMRNIRKTKEVKEKFNSVADYFKIPTSVLQNQETDNNNQAPLSRESKAALNNSVDLQNLGIEKIIYDNNQAPFLGESYRVPHKDALVCALNKIGNLTLSGCARLQVLLGKVEVLGHVISGPSDSYDLFSPTTASSLTIEVLERDAKPSDCEVFQILSNKYGLSEIEVKDIKSKLENITALLVLEKFDNKLIKLVDQKHFDMKSTRLTQTYRLFKGLGFKIEDAGFSYNISVKKHPEWVKINTTDKTILCGGKGVGKSTLLRYLVNKSLNTFDQVLVLDLDPGQSEFTPPGCVSAVIVTCPLLGPHYTHVQTPERMTYLGEIDISQCPLRYMESVYYITQIFNEHPEYNNIPCFINTMGFCKGIGVDLMINVLKLTQPQTVVQLHSKNDKKNYSFNLSSDCLRLKTFYKLDRLNASSNFDYGFIKISSSVEDYYEMRSGSPREFREMLQLSYFSPLVTNTSFTINNVVPFRVNFSDVYVTSNKRMSFVNILQVVNGSLVGLCSYDSSYGGNVHEYSYPDYFKIVTNNKVLPCFGFGVVRGTDCNKKQFYIISPLTVQEIQKVNCLSLGSIGPPGTLFATQILVSSSNVCYTAHGSADYIQRKFKT